MSMFHVDARGQTHLDTHRVDIDLLVQIIQKRNRLNHHRVHLVGGELELETRERVTETERHGVEVFLVDAAEERSELLADTTVQVLRRAVAQNGDIQGRLDSGSELGVGHDQHLLDGLLFLLLFATGSASSASDVDKEFREGVGQATVLDGGQILDGSGGRGEPLDGLDLEAISSARSLHPYPDSFPIFQTVQMASKTLSSERYGQTLRGFSSSAAS